MQKVGTTAECFAHFADAHRPESVKIICVFTQVPSKTVQDWMYNKGFRGVGLNLIKLRYMLELAGYDVIELRHIPETNKNMGRAIAYGLLTLEELVPIYRFSNGVQPFNQLLRVLLGKGSVVNERMAHVRDYEQQLLPRLQERRNEVLTRQPELTVNIESSSDTRKVADEPNQHAEAPRISSLRPTQVGEHDLLIDAAAGLVNTLLPLADLLLSDAYSAEDRSRLRERAGGDGIFKLANRLNRLCGEKARSHIQQPAIRA